MNVLNKRKIKVYIKILFSKILSHFFLKEKKVYKWRTSGK